MIPDGIHFGLPEDAYHADPAFSSSGAKDILVSPLTYWMKSALNPDKEERTSDSQARGKAFHTRILEGAEVFSERYAVKPDPEDYPGVLMKSDELKERCDELGLTKTGTNAVLCQRILEADPAAVLWPVIMERFKEETADKEIVSADLMNEINRQARIVELHDNAVKAFAGGHSEVSAFWVDTEHGVRMKARFDYLKTRAVVDLKTFANMLDQPIDDAIARAVANNGYHVQGAIYSDAVENVKALYRDQGDACIHGNAPEDDWLNAFADPKPHAFIFVFLEAGPVPNLRIREFRQTESGAKSGATQNLYWQSGWEGYRYALRRYRECMEQYGPDMPWFDPKPMSPFIDDEFPVYMFN